MVYNPDFRHNLGEGYGKSPVYRVAGFYTFRYLKLCCRNTNTLTKDQLQSIDDLLHFERNNCFISKWIRIESLERDFMDMANSSGERLADDFEQLILSQKKINTSSKSHPTAFYYNEESIQAVKEKEAVIIEKFDYTFPRANDVSVKTTKRTDQMNEDFSTMCKNLVT